MKRLLYILLITTSITLSAQGRKTFIASEDMEKGNIPARPYLRVTSKPIVLSNVWQKVIFDGQSDFNANTFPIKNNKPEVRLENGNFKFNTEGLRIYSIDSYWALRGDVLGTTRVFVKHKITNTAIEFPFPDSYKQFQLMKLGRNERRDVNYAPDFRTTEIVRQEGLEIWVRSNTKNPKIEQLIFIIYGL